MLARRALRRLRVLVVAGEDTESRGLVGRQMGVVDDAAAADDADAVIGSGGQWNRVVDGMAGEVHRVALQLQVNWSGVTSMR